MKKSTAILAIILTALTATSERARYEFEQLPMFWKVLLSVGTISLFTLIALRFAGYPR